MEQARPLPTGTSPSALHMPLRKFAGPHVASKRLGLLNADIWLQHHMGQVIGNAAKTLSLETPMEG
jgi:hypothetical protein